MSAEPTPPAGARDQTRARLALLAISSGLGAAVAYVALRGYVALRVGPMVPVLVVRTSSIAYYQALAVAAVLGIGWGLFVHQHTEQPEARARIERVLERAALPAIVACAVLAWVWP